MRKKYLSDSKIVERGHWEKSHYVSKSNTGFWSKYGGGRYVELTEPDVWICQACNEEQPKVFPQYSFEYPQGEKVKICVMCRHILIRHELQSFLDLIRQVRHTGIFNSLANLLTIPLSF